MKATEFAAMKPEEIKAKIAELKSELFTLRFQLATGQLQNTTAISKVKKDIARANTVLRQQELKAQQ